MRSRAPTNHIDVTFRRRQRNWGSCLRTFPVDGLSHEIKMPKKRSKTSEIQTLKVTIKKQLTAAGNEIFSIFKERGDIGDLNMLKMLVNQRLSAALEEIFVAFEETVASESQESMKYETDSKQRDQSLSVSAGGCPGDKSNHSEAEPPSGGSRAGTRSRAAKAGAQEPSSADGADVEEGGEEEAPHPCRVCGRAYQREGFLLRHAERHTMEAACVCGVCGERAASAAGLRLHVHAHREASRRRTAVGQDGKMAARARTHKEPRGEDALDSRGGLERHAQSLLGEEVGSGAGGGAEAPARPYRCLNCGRAFPRRASLERHARLHGDGEHPHVCAVCGRVFAEGGVLRRHARGHARPHACDACGKTFAVAQHLQVHQRIHTGEKPFACRVCGKRFRQVGNLDSHARIHTGDKPFICALCGKRFRQKVSLETHERFHRAERRHACPLCGKAFVQKVDLQRHGLTHTGEKPHGCTRCAKRYQEKRSLDAHVRVVHAGEVVAAATPGPDAKQQEGLHANFMQL